MRIISGKNRGTKLYTLEGLDTRPTLDRVKESLFNIIGTVIPESVVLDLFSGSGAIGLEMISRGAKKAFLCDNSPKAINIIEKNVEKLKVNENVGIIRGDYEKALEILKNEKINIIFLDPPYKTDYAIKACKKIGELKLLTEDGIVIIETDRKEEIKNEILELDLYEIYDERKYGRAYLIFLKAK